MEKVEPAHAPREKRGAWWPVAVGSLLMLVGLPIAAVGAWLFVSGLSWYYLPAGIGLFLTGYFLCKRDSSAFWVYLVTYLVTLAWAQWESGLVGWAEAQELIAPTLVLVLVLTTLPLLRGPVMRVRTGVVAAVVTLFGLVGVMTVGGQSISQIAAQESAPALDAVPSLAGLMIVPDLPR